MGRLYGQGVETDLRRLRQADHSERQGRTEEQRSWVFKRERLTWGAGMRGLRQWAVCRPKAALQRPASLQPHPRQSPPMRPARPMSGPSPLPPAPANSGSSSNPTKPTAAKGFKCPMSPMMVRHPCLVTAYSVPAEAWLGDSEMRCTSPCL